MNAVELQSIRTKEYMVLEVTKAYMQLQLGYKDSRISYQLWWDEINSANKYQRNHSSNDWCQCNICRRTHLAWVFYADPVSFPKCGDE